MSSDAVITFPILGEGFSLSFKPYFTLFGWTFHWYGIIIAFGFLLAALYAFKRAKSFGLTEDNIVDMLIFTVPLAIIGARAYYVIFSYDEFRGDFWSIFEIWNGGLAIYGGVIGALIGLLIYTKVKKVPFGPIADVGALGLLIGQAIGRWGNFVNREAYGERTDVPWRMGLTNEYGTFYYHPTFLYESLWNILGFVLLHFYSKKKRKFDGEIFLMYLVWYGIGRLYIEGLRTDSLYIPGTDLRVSQLVALACILVGGGLLLYHRIAKNHTPEELWVNRKEAAAEAMSEPEDTDASDQEADMDEALQDAFRILSYRQQVQEDDAEPVEDGPVIEPIHVELSDTDVDDEEDTEQDGDAQDNTDNREE